MLPNFDAEGLLTPGDYLLSLDALRESLLVTGPEGGSSTWDAGWRATLVENLGILVRQLWAAGVTDIFVDGSFAEDKDHPNDIDGYFACDLMRLASGSSVRELNLLDPHLEFPAAFRLSRRNSRLKGIVKIGEGP